MQVGCGFRVKSVHGQDYVYFWHYEDRDGHSRQVYEYMGPRRSSGTASRLVAAVEAYYMPQRGTTCTASWSDTERRSPPCDVHPSRDPRFPQFRGRGLGAHL